MKLKNRQRKMRVQMQAHMPECKNTRTTANQTSIPDTVFPSVYGNSDGTRNARSHNAAVIDTQTGVKEIF